METLLTWSVASSAVGKAASLATEISNGEVAFRVLAVLGGVFKHLGVRGFQHIDDTIEVWSHGDICYKCQTGFLSDISKEEMRSAFTNDKVAAKRKKKARTKQPPQAEMPPTPVLPALTDAMQISPVPSSSVVPSSVSPAPSSSILPCVQDGDNTTKGMNTLPEWLRNWVTTSKAEADGSVLNHEYHRVIQFIEDLCMEINKGSQKQDCRTPIVDISLMAQCKQAQRYHISDRPEDPIQAMLNLGNNLQQLASIDNEVQVRSNTYYYNLYHCFVCFAQQVLQSGAAGAKTPKGQANQIFKALHSKLLAHNPSFNYSRFKQVLDRSAPLFMITNYLGANILNFPGILTANSLARMKAGGLQMLYQLLIKNPGFRDTFQPVNEPNAYAKFSSHELFHPYHTQYWIGNA
ncbi:hypothetical protein K493DRAFT_300571 [Basidiobolus meristosporus CBS 931.73]|uniref:Uncharacterized protein n=1 Tax=Basidiobolus meristosporus CBS 931.73 TaxID=1314790 RepID=A0A1Y1YGI3_9FUNG|nr:hypothetical protein K493DRAFT_300571 [Basidiobolus meristosporus CBS 931.73]|eukprot:ORX97150.1 hypothetical protein K493DRAFT_300571 [Basidiobolus meristosporus CBS 931.73]